MKIIIEPEVMERLRTFAIAWPREFSGFGFCRLEKEVVRIYDFVLLALGSEVFTEIPTKKILALMERSDAGNMKVWLHRHPMGSGVPGRENWSGTDENTIQTNPLGGMPEMVKWSVSVVLTPRGWVGRIDNHIAHTTVHLEVEPSDQAARQELDAIRNEVRVTTPDPFQGGYISQDQKAQRGQMALDAQEGRPGLEGIFDELDQVRRNIEEVGNLLQEQLDTFQVVSDRLYSAVDQMVGGIPNVDEVEGLDEEEVDFADQRFAQAAMQFRGVVR